jgi:hypothetical protein
MVYHILLMITDGAICDLVETKLALVELSFLPCSVIIVGVGSADFTSMEVLDSDKGQLEAVKNQKFMYAKRDIVQFVEFNKCVAKGALGEKVLKEIPPQLCMFMT